MLPVLIWKEIVSWIKDRTPAPALVFVGADRFFSCLPPATRLRREMTGRRHARRLPSRSRDSPATLPYSLQQQVQLDPPDTPDA